MIPADDERHVAVVERRPRLQRECVANHQYFVEEARRIALLVARLHRRHVDIDVAGDPVTEPCEPVVQAGDAERGRPRIGAAPGCTEIDRHRDDAHGPGRVRDRLRALRLVAGHQAASRADRSASAASTRLYRSF